MSNSRLDLAPLRRWAQYSPLITKYEPRIVPASFDFCRANLNEPSSAGISMPSESLNPTARFFGSSSVYSDVDREPVLVEDVGPSDVLDLDGRRLERRRSDDDVALLLEDAVNPLDGLLGLGGGFDREYEVVLVLEVASFVRSQAGQRGRHRRRLQADGGDVDEVHRVAHGAMTGGARGGGEPLQGLQGSGCCAPGALLARCSR